MKVHDVISELSSHAGLHEVQGTITKDKCNLTFTEPKVATPKETAKDEAATT
jgi:hypothetical protein